MKNTGHYITQIIVSLVLSMLILPGCVAKKKFVEMENYRTKAELRVVELTRNVSNLQQEFNNYKNSFHYSNSTKDAYVDSLSKVIVGLNTDLLSTSENIEDQIFSFQVEKRRLNQLLADKDREIRMAQRSNETIKAQIDGLNVEITNLSIKLKNATSSGNANEEKINGQKVELENLAAQLQKKNADFAQLKTEINSKNEEIKTLQNQVKLLKEQFGQ
ncbi:MAG: hypothetical protein ACERKD_06390 [Prolixibacteraceae bacterium]